MPLTIENGKAYAGPYPFHRWSDGRWDLGRDDAGEFVEGQAVYHVVSVHELPKPYKPRVFYTVTFIEPDGEHIEAGPRTLRITTLPAFLKLLTSKPRKKPDYGSDSGGASKGFRA